MGGSETSNGVARLDSWKAIAAHLGRDVATVRRWERTRGLPIHRVPGGKGGSVFAYADEIDAWLKSAPQESAVTSPPPIPANSGPAAVAFGRWRGAGGAAAIGVLLVLGWWWQQGQVSAADLRVEITERTVRALTVDGADLWTYRLSDSFRHALSEVSERARVIGGASPAVYFTTSHATRQTDNTIDGGQFTSLDLQGRHRWTFQFDDQVRFGGESYTAPWAMTAFEVDAAVAPRKIAVAAHHWTWGPSIAAILDDSGKRLGTFASDGWIEQLRWIAPDRLVIGGFLESQNGGMVALLDPAKINGHSPEQPGSKHECQSCGPHLPLRMAVMPRTEVNLLTRSRFNRAILEWTGDRLIVRTVEVPAQGQGVADAIYEFSPGLDLLRASFSQRYWEIHDQLEAEKKVDHNRANCPDRDGPRAIQHWTPRAGWRTASPGEARP